MSLSTSVLSGTWQRCQVPNICLESGFYLEGLGGARSSPNISVVLRIVPKFPLPMDTLANSTIVNVLAQYPIVPSSQLVPSHEASRSANCRAATSFKRSHASSDKDCRNPMCHAIRTLDSGSRTTFRDSSGRSSGSASCNRR